MTGDSAKLGQSSTGSPTRRHVLRATAGTAVAIVAVPAVSGVVAAHFPTELTIDIQPENADNYIDLDVHETVAVAVQRTEFINSDGERETFDPTEEAVRYRFGSKNALRNGDGARPVDEGEVITMGGHGHGNETEALLLEFPVDETGLDGGEEAAWLYWERDESGEHGYSGVDAVNVYGTDNPNRDLLEMIVRLLRRMNS
jgi:hypothetical protein